MGVKRVTERSEKVCSRFCKKIMAIPNCATNGFAEIEIGRERSAYDRK
jgi:hypothetical protein